MATGIIVIVLLAIVFGALSGGENFGDTMRKGLGCIFSLVVLVVGVLIFIEYKDRNSGGSFSGGGNSGGGSSGLYSSNSEDNGTHTFVVRREDTPCYVNPNKNSAVDGYVSKGDTLYIEGINEYKYFYRVELKDEQGNLDINYLLKDHLRKID